MKKPITITLQRELVGRDHKFCPDCDRVKPATEFYKNRKKYDGLAGICKVCSKERLFLWRKKNPVHVKKYFKQYRDSHPDMQKKMHQRDWKIHKEKRIKHHKSYYQRNKEWLTQVAIQKRIKGLLDL